MGLHGVQVVGGSNPPCPTKSNHLRKKHLTPTPSPTTSAVSAQVSNRASNLRREEIVSHRLESDDLRAGVLAPARPHGPEEPHLAHRARRLAGRGAADDREVAAARPLPRAEGVPLRSADPLRPGRSPSRDRAAHGNEATSRRAPSPRRVKRVRRRDRLVGFTYDEAAGVAHFSMYVPGTAGRDRKRVTVRAASHDEAVRLWSEFRSRAAEGLSRPSPEAPTFREFITDYFSSIEANISEKTA